jgi:hypothetical protein
MGEREWRRGEEERGRKRFGQRGEEEREEKPEHFAVCPSFAMCCKV